MRLSVRFVVPSFFLLRLGKRLGYMGPGILHLQETGLVADGDLPRFRVPVIDHFYHRILAVRCTRTIPYSAILDLRPASRWPRWIAKGFVLLVLALFLAGLIAALVYGDRPVACGLGIAVVGTLVFVTVFAGRRVYKITFRDPDGRKCRFFFSVKSKKLAQEFSYRAAVAAVEAAGVELPEAAPCISAGLSSQEETEDWAPPAFQPFEVQCPECGRRRKITRPEVVGTLIPCKACETSYLVRRVGQDVRELLAKQARAPAKTARAKSDQSTRFEAIGAALMHSAGWASAALLACVLIHAAAAAARGGAEQFPDVPVIRPLAYSFYYPGTQLYALFIGEPGRVWGPRVGFHGWAPLLAVLITCLFWSSVVGFLGFFSHAARPEPQRSPGETVVRLAKWLPVACGVLLLGWLARDYLQLRTYTMEQKAMQEAMDEGIQRLFYDQLSQQYFHGARDGARSAHGSRQQETTAREVEDCLQKARALEEQGKFFDAQPYYEEAVELAPGLARPQDQAMLHMLLGRNLARQSKHARAQEWYEKALEVLRDRAEQSREVALVHNDVALSLDAQGNHAEAAMHYERALSRAKDVVIHMNYANHLLRRNMHAVARSHFDAAHRRGLGGRTLTVWYSGSAGNLMALGRYGEAHRHASEASALADKEPISEVEKAQIRLVRQNTSLALVFRFFFFGILVAIALHIAWHAGKCGYPPLLWIAAGLLSGLPMANLAVLASLRDLRLEKERARLRREVMQLVALSQSSRP